MTQPVDSSILHEIVRIVESRRKVPDKVIVTSKEYLLTYLEDHRNRLEEALLRFDRDRLNMLYGQLASKVKYQLLRRVPTRAATAVGLSKGKAAKAVAKKAAAPKPATRKAAPTKAKARAKKAAVAKGKKAGPAKKKAAAAKGKKKPGARKAKAAARPKKKTRR